MCESLNYDKILNELNPKCREYFDSLNKDSIYEWNEHTFDVVYIMIKCKNYKSLPDKYVRMMLLSTPSIWPIFLEDKEFTSEVIKACDENFHMIPVDEQEKISKIIDIFKIEHPELLKK
jgi:hypothetical protein